MKLIAIKLFEEVVIELMKQSKIYLSLKRQKIKSLKTQYIFHEAIKQLMFLTSNIKKAFNYLWQAFILQFYLFYQYSFILPNLFNLTYF